MISCSILCIYCCCRSTHFAVLDSEEKEIPVLTNGSAESGETVGEGEISKPAAEQPGLKESVSVRVESRYKLQRPRWP